MTQRNLLLPLLLAAPLGAAASNPGYYFPGVYDEAVGTVSTELRYWQTKANGRPALRWPELGLGLQISERWSSLLLASWIDNRRRPMRLETWNWQNDWRLSDARWPLDLALHSLLVRPQGGGDGLSLELGPVLQTEFGRWQLGGQLLAVRELERSSTPTELKYGWQLRYSLRPGLRWGLQGFGELGAWRDALGGGAPQSHRAGPALFGSLALGDGRLHWQAAYLVGKTAQRPGAMFTARLRYAY